MGSSSSRPGPLSTRARPNRSSSRFFSSLICGGSSSFRTARHERHVSLALQSSEYLVTLDATIQVLWLHFTEETDTHAILFQ
ncbi:hypothetical protein NC652_017158 [Populus alba x Populus x berolinensis]|nr:hypothetical protein NC652_017158 [Populus alba x Populus x berolinensis]